MGLTSGNGQVGMQYRFAHEYHVRPGETMLSIAERFGTSVDHLLHLNENLITNVNNPRCISRLRACKSASRAVHFVFVHADGKHFCVCMHVH